MHVDGTLIDVTSWEVTLTKDASGMLGLAMVESECWGLGIRVGEIAVNSPAGAVSRDGRLHQVCRCTQMPRAPTLLPLRAHAHTLPASPAVLPAPGGN